MICSNCGTQNIAGAKFCMECASPLASGCPNCGFVNLPNAKFCSECATPLAAGAGARRAAVVPASPAPGTERDAHGDGAGAAERRVVSVLFADLVGFTPFAEERDAEEIRETLTRYFDLAREVIERYGGTVEKFIGDAVMAVWGAPVAQEDDAERAVRAALDLVDAVRSLGPAIQARAGVLTGEAAVTLGATNQGMVAGDLVNTAARLQTAAEPGTVLVGEATQRAAQRSIVFGEVGEQHLKGKSSPVPAWRALRVVAQRAGRGRADTLEAPFVGRDEEMRLLKDLFHATNREGRPRLVSVIGPAGIGKSRLAWEFLKYVDGLQETVWWHDGRSPAYGDGITFWALGEMVRSRAGLLESDDPATTREKVAAMLHERVPEADERALIQPAILALLGLETAADPQALFPAWRTFFERLAATNPVVMVFEDLHFADPGLLDFIDHVLEWSRNAAITIVTLARPELLERRPTWGAGKRSFTSITLEPLPPVAMRELLAGLVPGLPEPAIVAIVTRADGIPLYAVETVRMLLAQGRLALVDGVYRPTGDLDEISVPETLTALIAARLDGLEATDRSLIADAAVLGQSFSAAALSAVSGEPQAAVENRLSGMVRRELLVQDTSPRSPERGQFVFVQALIREVAYNTLARKDRKTRHLAAARHFESLGSDELAGALAGHYLAAYRLAGEGPEAEALAAQARVALRGAADRAAALGSHEQALVLLEHALTVTTDHADRAELHERAFAEAMELLESEPVLRHAEAALAERRRLGDRERIAAAEAARARAVTRSKGNPEKALALATEALEEFSDLEQTPAGAALMDVIVHSLGGLNRMAEELEWTNRLIPVAERLDLMPELLSATLANGTATATLGRPRQGDFLVRGAHAMALSLDIHDVEKMGRTLLTFIEQWGDPAAGLQLGREGLEIARRIGSTSYGFQMVGNGVICAIRVGEWDWARALLDEWLPPDASGIWYSELHWDRALLRLLAGGDASGDLGRATELRAGITDPQFESYDEWVHGWDAFTQGRFTEARERARAASDRTTYFHPLADPLEARAAVWEGNVYAAQHALARLAQTTYRGLALAEDVRTIRAGVAALEGRPAEALTLYRESLRAWQSLRLAWDHALAAIDAAALLRSDDPEIRAATDEARATLTQLGARPYLARLEAALGAPKREAGTVYGTSPVSSPA